MSIYRDITDPALTRRGRLSVLYYAVRALVTAPAPAEDRCFMGAPIGEHVQCPRPVDGDGIWCSRHAAGLTEGPQG